MPNRPVQSMSELGTNIRHLGQALYSGLKEWRPTMGHENQEYSRTWGDRPSGKVQPGIYGPPPEMVEADLGPKTIQIMKGVAKGLRGAGRNMPKRWRKNIQIAARSIPEQAAGDIDGVVVEGFGKGSEGVMGSMRRTMDGRNLLRINSEFSNPRGFTPKFVRDKMEGHIVHEGTHASQRRLKKFPKDLADEMEHNARVSIMKNSMDRYAVLDDAARKAGYESVLHEVHARAMSRSHELFRLSLKKGSGMKTKDIDNMYRQAFNYEADQALKGLKATNPAEYDAITKMTKMDMEKLYGNKANKVLKDMIK